MKILDITSLFLCTVSAFAETKNGYGPNKSVASRGAEQILGMFEETPKLYGQF